MTTIQDVLVYIATRAATDEIGLIYDTCKDRSKALRNVGPAVLSALVVTDLWGPSAPPVGTPELLGVLAAGLAAWRTRNLIVAVVVGMVVRWVLLAVGL